VSEWFNGASRRVNSDNVKEFRLENLKTLRAQSGVTSLETITS